MSMREYKYEILIGSVMAIAVSFLFYELMTIKPKKIKSGSDISFEMARPKNEIHDEFSLNDREINESFVNPYVKKPAEQAKNVLPNNTSKTKKDENKKNSQNSKQANNKRKTGISTRAISREKNRRFFTEQNDNETDVANYLEYQQPKTKKKSKKQKQEELNPNNENRKSVSDFADLLTNPQPERINEFVNSVKKGEIPSDEMLTLVGQMIKSDNSQVQNSGIYICYYFPNVSTFGLVAAEFDHLSEGSHQYATEFLNSFQHPSKLPVLAQALQSNNTQIIIKAGEVIILGLQNIKNGQNIVSGGRTSRGNNEIQPASFLDYFLSIAESLKSNPDQTVASLGTSLSSQLSQYSSSN